MIPEGAFLAILVVILLCVLWLLYRLIACPTNELEWTDLVSTRGRLNSYKLGWWVGVFIGAWVVIKQTYMGSLDTGIFLSYLGFLGGVGVANSAIGAKGKTDQSRKVDNPDG